MFSLSRSRSRSPIITLISLFHSSIPSYSLPSTLYNPPLFRRSTPQHTRFLLDFLSRHSFPTIITLTSNGEFRVSHLPIAFEPVPDGSETNSTVDQPNATPVYGRLFGHFALQNGQWSDFAHSLSLLHSAAPLSSSVQYPLLIFTGPHSYISANYYATSPHVPTYNFECLHARIRVNKLIRDRNELIQMLQRQVKWEENRVEKVFNQHNQQKTQQEADKSTESTSATAGSSACPVSYHRNTSGRPWQMSDLPAKYLNTNLDQIVGFEADIIHLEAKVKMSQNRGSLDWATLMDVINSEPLKASNPEFVESMNREYQMAKDKKK